MAKQKAPELRFQCLNCYKTYKGPDAEQKALDCCGSFIQGWWANYNKWGKQHWFGRLTSYGPSIHIMTAASASIRKSSSTLLFLTASAATADTDAAADSTSVPIVTP